MRLDRRLLQLVALWPPPPPGSALGSGLFCSDSSANDLDRVFVFVAAVVAVGVASSSSSFAKSETLNETN